MIQKWPVWYLQSKSQIEKCDLILPNVYAYVCLHVHAYAHTCLCSNQIPDSHSMIEK